MTARIITVLCLAGAAILALSLLVGSVDVPSRDLPLALIDRTRLPLYHDIVWGLRLPRALIALAAGGMLGLAGALLQAVTRNPLAAPELMGVSAGAVLAIVASFLVSSWLGGQGVVRQTGTDFALAGLAGGMAAGCLTYALSRDGGDGSRLLVLIGVLVTGAASALSSMLLLSADEDQIKLVMRWIIGSLEGRVWMHWQALWPLALPGIALGLASAGVANLLQLGESVATSLGLRVGPARLGLIFIASLLTAGAISIIGGVGFIGLIGPHLARRLVGGDARPLFPVSFLLSALLLLLADLTARALPLAGITHWLSLPVSAAAGLPVGAVTPVLGVPFFLALLYLHRRGRLG